jgi:outer membrane protein OmpA-like peptidoglycan-associated protein
MMNAHPELKFEVSGHTDSDGNDASNLNLSTERAIVVKNKLISLGISGDRLTTKGYGETNPISDNTTAEGKANNRRVEFLKINS